MDKEEQVYRDLQVHLDRMPVSFPATESGVEIRVLKHLFTPEEAAIACELSMLPEPAGRIHKRLKKSPVSLEELKTILDRMARKGTINAEKKGEKTLYQNLPLAIGMYEFQVERLTKEFANDFLQYLDESFADAVTRTGVPLLRTIPVEKSIPLAEKHLVSNYDDVRYLVENAQGKIAVANCVCRQTKDLAGDSCKVTDLRETCILTSPVESEYYTSNGIGRYITKEEALEILDKAQAAGLVLQPVNARQPEAICCCCGDCCGVLASIKKLPHPADMFASNYYAEVDPELCNSCGICVDNCQLDAAVLNDGVVTINLDRCIGCGNCVVNCPASALHLSKKSSEQSLPKDLPGVYTRMLKKKAGNLGILKVAAKALLKQKV